MSHLNRVACLVLGAVLTTAAAPLTLPAGTANAAGPAMCLDVGTTRNNGDGAKIWQCARPTDWFLPNQTFVIEGGQIKVANTLGGGQPMCLDVGTTRNNGDRAKIWQCARRTDWFLPNQAFVIAGGQVKVANTLS